MHYHPPTMTRKPNTKCAICGGLMYRRPYQLAAGKGKFCSRACRNKAHPHTGKRATSPAMLGEGNPAWKGGRYTEPDKGYVMVRMPGHPRARRNGYVLEHLLVAEQMSGRALRPAEEVHHINRNRADNRPENLKVFADHTEHWMGEHYEDVARARDAANSRRNTKATGLH